MSKHREEKAPSTVVVCLTLSICLESAATSVWRLRSISKTSKGLVGSVIVLWPSISTINTKSCCPSPTSALRTARRSSIESTDRTAHCARRERLPQVLHRRHLDMHCRLFVAQNEEIISKLQEILWAFQKRSPQSCIFVSQRLDMVVDCRLQC